MFELQTEAYDMIIFATFTRITLNIFQINFDLSNWFYSSHCCHVAIQRKFRGNQEPEHRYPETDSESIVISFEIKVKHLKKAVRKAMVTKKKDKKENKSKKKKESKAKGSRKETRNRGPRQRSRTRSSVRTRSASVSRTRSATRFGENRLQGLKKNVYGSC